MRITESSGDRKKIGSDGLSQMAYAAAPIVGIDSEPNWHSAG
jgi:hypothetical protein